MIRAPLRIRLTLDDGLASYVRALVASPVGIFGDERDTIIFATRAFMIDKMAPGNGFRDPIIDHLPADLQKQWRR
jgi:hypothetical protein